MTSPSTLILDITSPILAQLGIQVSSSVDPSMVCVVGNGFNCNADSTTANIRDQIITALATPGYFTSPSGSIGTNQYFGDCCPPPVGDVTTCDSTSYPSSIQTVYSSPLNFAATINGHSLTEIIQNPFGTIFTMSPLTGVFAGTISAGNPIFSTTFTEPFNINPGDFVSSDGNLYIIISYNCSPVSCTGFSGCDQNYVLNIKVYLYLNPQLPYFTRCCASIGITPQLRQSFCPADYTLDNQVCIDEVGTYCADSETFSDPVCGCYPEYIQKEIVDTNPTLKNLLNKFGQKLLSGCSKSCNAATAYTGGKIVQECTLDLTVCEADMANMGEITGGITVDQYCDGDGNGNGNGNGPPPPTISKTVIIASIAAGAVILLVLIFLVIMIL